MWNFNDYILTVMEKRGMVYMEKKWKGMYCGKKGGRVYMLDCKRSLLSAGLDFRACERKGGTANNT